ncbi:MAG: pantetheine-phosphate adenylyltransferase [Endomicrobiaceae bacterium]|nr:pantetheine-phosphate adenylyltransferase [Endomicrobiaceae bacterium]
MKNEKIIAVYPGSFDPPTNGHIDIIGRASKIFPKVVVAITHNYNKSHMFSLEERLVMMKEAVSNIKNVEVSSFSGLLVDYLNKIDSFCIVRGLRALSDFEYEFQMALMNRKLKKDVETVFLMPDQEYTFLSSSMVREIASLGGQFKNFVPKSVYKKIISKRKLNV